MTPETPRSIRAFLHGGLWTMGCAERPSSGR